MSDDSLPSPEQALALIRSRRTVKPDEYAPRPIERGVIERLIEAAGWAPTHGRNEPWRFRVYGGDGLAELDGILRGLMEAVTPPAKRDEAKLAKLSRSVAGCSHAIAVFTSRADPGKIPLQEDIEATACAVQNLMLAARAFGIGSFWSTNTVDYRDPPGASFPGAGPDERYLGVVFLGFPRDGFPAGHRSDPRNKVQWIG